VPFAPELAAAGAEHRAACAHLEVGNGDGIDVEERSCAYT